MKSILQNCNGLQFENIAVMFWVITHHTIGKVYIKSNRLTKSVVYLWKITVLSVKISSQSQTYKPTREKFQASTTHIPYTYYSGNCHQPGQFTKKLYFYLYYCNNKIQSWIVGKSATGISPVIEKLKEISVSTSALAGMSVNCAILMWSLQFLRRCAKARGLLEKNERCIIAYWFCASLYAKL